MTAIPSRPDEVGELEIRVRAGTGESFPVELAWSGGQDFPAGSLDAAALLPWVESLDPGADGERLFRALFAGDALAAAWAELAGESPRRRLRLRIDPEAARLHALPWELLAEPRADGPPRPLAAQAATPFSRYLPCRRRPRPPVLERPVRLLAAVADPAALPARLPPLDVEAETAALTEVLAAVPAGQIEPVFLPAPVTLERLEAALQEGCHVLHLVAHGEFLAGGDDGSPDEAVLYLADAEGRATRVAAAPFAAMLERLATPPHLVFLASCSSAQRSPGDAFVGLAPQLLLAGTAAVVAMQKPVLVPTARAFAIAFYRRLLAHGEVDLAANEARSALLTGELPGAEVPVVFQRLRSGRLLGDRGEVQGKTPEIFWHPLLRDGERGRITPVLGPGIHHGLLPMPRQIARALAANPAFGYPYGDEGNLPRVAQYLASHRPGLPHEEVRELLARELARRLPAGAAAAGSCVSELADRAGWGGLTRDDESEVHHQLAGLGLPLYLTTNYDNLLTLALAERGRRVHRMALPWRAAQRGEALDADAGPPPSPAEPVVLHLFGCDEDPESMVLTEDDYLDYLAVISRAEDNLLPAFASEALAFSSVVFLGYRLRDLDLRVLLRGFIARLDTRKFTRRSQIAVQFDPKAGDEPGGEAARGFLEKYFGQSQIDVYWGSAPQFVADLVSRLPPPAAEAGDG